MARLLLDGHVREADFLDVVTQLAGYGGWRHYHTRDSRGCVPGFPDLVLVRERVVFAELKAAEGRLTDAQRGWLRGLRNAGAEVHVWRPGDLDAVERLLLARGVA